MAVTPYEIHIDAALGDPSKEHGVEFTFYPKGEHTSPFDIAEWPEIRKNLRKEVRKRMSDLESWQNYLLSDRLGERYSVRVGVVYLDNDDGSVDEWKLTYTSPEDVNW